MSVSYNKLWKILIDRKMSHIDLQRASKVAPYYNDANETRRAGEPCYSGSDMRRTWM